jgi:hypothetical protein
VLGVDRLHGLDVPSTLAEVCRPERLALVVYDMQDGILGEIDDRDRLVARVREVLDIARGRGVKRFFTRHVTLPVELMGVAQLLLWRTWQRVDRLEDVRSPFPPDAPQTQIVSELAPTNEEAVLDKLTFSAFVGSPLELALRGAGVMAVAVVGVGDRDRHRAHGPACRRPRVRSGRHSRRLRRRRRGRRRACDGHAEIPRKLAHNRRRRIPRSYHPCG